MAHIDSLANNLSAGHSFWPLLALDHGLSESTDAVKVGSVKSLLDACAQNIGAAVMTYGLARFTSAANHVTIVVQCIGAPVGHRKVQVCSVADAINVGASGISVQINFGLEHDQLTEQIQTIAALVGQAHANDLPALFMIAPIVVGSLHDFEFPIRVCQELGADLVKVTCSVTELVALADLRVLRNLLSSSPPVLLAGGVLRDDLLSVARTAHDAGFSGYCVGRNVYLAEDPARLTADLNQVWYNRGPYS